MFFRKQKPLHELADEELLLRYKKEGDTALVGELYKRYTALVFGVCMKYLKNVEESEDMVMQVFEKLLEDLKRFEVANFKGWLHRVARNECLMLLRKKKSTGRRMDLLAKTEDTYVEPEQDMHLQERELELTRLETAIRELKAEQRTCVELFYLQNKCYTEVAEITGYSVREVKSYLQNGRRNLKIRLTDNGQP